METEMRDGENHYDLQRFLDAQACDYEEALAEIRAGRKRSHWIWYIFPQLVGLGNSRKCDFYGIRGLGEATAYLAHPVLRDRLVEISRALLSLDTNDPVAVLGSMGRIDAKKLRACMTLFSSVEGANPVFGEVLDKYYAGVPDPRTIEMLRQG